MAFTPPAAAGPLPRSGRPRRPCRRGKVRRCVMDKASRAFWSWLQDFSLSALVCGLRMVVRCLPKAPHRPPQSLPPQPRVLWCHPRTPAQCVEHSDNAAPPFQLGASGTEPDPVSPSEWCRSRSTATGAQTGPRLDPGGWQLPSHGEWTVPTTGTGREDSSAT